MADYLGIPDPGITDQNINGNRYTLSSVGATAKTARGVPASSITGVEFIQPDISGSGDFTLDYMTKYTPVLDSDGVIVEGGGYFWFERLHSYPSILELGNILSTVERDIEIYNSYRTTVQTLNTATNNVGTGVSFQNLPSLPANISPNDGLVFQVRVTTQGQPSLDGTLDFTTSVYPLSIDLTAVRIVMMAYEPHGEIQESLEFLTNIIRSANGKEQRIRVRNYPRQTFDYFYMIPDGDERRRLEAFLYKWHPQTFGVPIWFEAQSLTAAVTSGSYTFNVPTDYSDFRVGGLMIVWQDYQTFDALEIQSMTSSQITTTSPATMNHAIGTKVMPLRTGVTKQEISGDKFPVNLHTVAIKFYITDNEVDIGSTTAFGTHNSKVMFEDANWIPRNTNTDTLKNLIHIIDNEIGARSQFSDWTNSHPITSKGFFCKNIQATWQMRQVLHALAGRQKSFYLPTFYNDVVVNDTLASGTSLMDIDHIGYTDYIGANEPNKSLYIVLNDGTVYTREVQSASEIDSTTERLVLDTTWPTNILPSEIYRISFLRLCRFAVDRFEINHTVSGKSHLKTPVQGVLQ